MKRYTQLSLFAIGAASLALLPLASAQAVDQTTTVNATIGSTITLAAPPTVNLAAVSPSSTAMASTERGDVSVSTNNATGYDLSIKMNGATNSLVSGSNNLVATTGDGALTVNSWGYAKDSAAAQSNVDLATVTTGTWQPVPVGTGVSLTNTNAPANNEVTPLRFGMSANSSQPSGSYTGQVIFTAVAK